MKRNIWIVLTLLTVASCAVVYKYFDRAMPFVHISITMDAHEARVAATEMANKLEWNVDGYCQSLKFSDRSEVQAFVELEGGGKQAYLDMIDKGYHQPYAWLVRFYKPGETKEYFVAFTPDGKPYEFRVKVPEQEESASVSRGQAEKIAREAIEGWNVDFAAYDCIEYHSHTQPNGRIDHDFVYERQDVTLKEGTYRLKLAVSGDTCTCLSRYIKIPDEFMRRYQEMYAHNILISTLSQNIAIALYIFVLLLSMFVLFYRSREFLQPRVGLYTFAMFFGLSLLSMINKLPLIWHDYATHHSVSTFLLSYLGMTMIFSFTLSVAISAIVVLVSASDRYAFAQHIQLFQSYRHGVGSSYQVLQQTLLGYGLALIMLGYEVCYNLLTNEHLGWWSPLSRLVDPQALLAYVPAFYPIATAIRVGCWEEFVFRGLPLAGIAFLTRKSKHKRWWILGMVVVQALIFGAVHANYPQQPAYNRLIELFLPSVIWAATYYWYGLLPCIIFHGVYDAILFSIPIFTSDLLLQKVIVIMGVLLPLWIVVWCWWKSKYRFVQAPESAYNRSQQLPDLDQSGLHNPERPVEAPVAGRVMLIMLAFGIAGAVCFYVARPWLFVVPGFTINKQKAIEVATDCVAAQDIGVGNDWTVFAVAVNPVDLPGNQFVWQTFGATVYSELQGSYVPKPYWVVAWKKFTGPVEDRAEEIKILVDGCGKVQGMLHKFPECLQGANLAESDAVRLAQKIVREWYGLERNSIELIECCSNKHAHRRDWSMTFKDLDGYRKKTGDATILVSLAGDQLSMIERKIKAPEVWVREQEAQETQSSIVNTLRTLLKIFMIVVAFLISLGRIKNFKLLLRPIGICGATLFVVTLLNMANDWDSVLNTMSTASPLVFQIISLFSNVLISALGFALLQAAILLVFMLNSSRRATVGSMFYRLCLIAGGIGFAGLQKLLSSFVISQQPDAADLLFINAWHSRFAIVSGHYLFALLSKGFTVGAAAILATWLISKKQHVLSVLLFLLLGLVLVPFESMLNIELWLATGLISGLLWMFVYYFVLSRDMAALLWILCGIAAVQFLPTVLSNAYPGVIDAFVSGSIVTLIICTKLYQKICKTK